MPHKDPVARREYHKAWARANRWKYREREKAYDAWVHANRRAAHYGAVGILSIEDVRAVLSRGVCHYCARPVERRDATIDHVDPLHSGGLNQVDNIVCACFSCNASKFRGDRPGRWARLHDHCEDCGTDDRPHVAKGCCGRCYLRRYQRRRRK